MTRVLRYILPVMLVAMMACSDEPGDDQHIPGDSIFDFVTLVATDQTGTTFAMQRTEQSPEVLLHSSYSFASSKTLCPGSRLMICYGIPDAARGTNTEATTIVLYGYLPMANTVQPVITDPADIPQGPGLPIRMVSSWRTGHYLNMHMQIYVFRPVMPKTMVLAVDPATIDDECPVARLHYTLADENVGENTNTVYASFDLSPLWDRPTCRRVRVEYLTPEGTEFSVFSKPE